MNMFKNLLAMLLLLCMVFSLCACGEGDENPENSTALTTVPSTTVDETEAPTVDDGKVTYTVKVVDEGGNPISCAMVQLCLEACIPGVTDASGVASYNVEEADYKVSLMSLPQGYAYTSDVQEFHFESGSYELTITLKAAA